MEMKCEHGINIHQTCEDCNDMFLSDKSHWETNQIRRELASVDLRLVELCKEREAERRRRIELQTQLREMTALVVTDISWLWPDASFRPVRITDLFQRAAAIQEKFFKEQL